MIDSHVEMQTNKYKMEGILYLSHRTIALSCLKKSFIFLKCQISLQSKKWKGFLLWVLFIETEYYKTSAPIDIVIVHNKMLERVENKISVYRI